MANLLRLEEKRERRMAEQAWSGLKPSRACVADAGNRRPDTNHLPHQGSLRGTNQWMPIARNDESSWGVASAGCLVPPSSGLKVPSAPGALKRLVSERAAATGLGHDGVLQHRQDWKRFSIPTWGEGKIDAQRDCHRFDNTPCSELKLDEELTMLESQITRTVSDHLSNLTSRTSRTSSCLSQEIAALVNESNSGVAKAGSSGQKLTKSSEGEVLKRQRSAVFETDGQGGRGWIHPLKLLIRKGLTLSDVGELGRIIIPKKVAESRSFPQIDTKDGAVLEMEDYSVSKRWYFRFKYWINNKSRMYVLENTGEFIKYHRLQEHDMFCVYEDGCKKLVVCGQKKSKCRNLYPSLEVLNLESSPSETPPTTSTTKDELSSRTTDVDNSVATRS